MPGAGVLEQCRRHWGVGSVGELLAELPFPFPPAPLVDVGDPAFIAPTDMPSEVRRRAGLPADTDRHVIVACIVESLADAVASSLSTLHRIGPVDELVVMGGAAQARVLLDRIADRTGLRVRVGPTEATTMGNALAQGRAMGCFDTTSAARAALPALT
jgi:rhamnulokinase